MKRWPPVWMGAAVGVMAMWSGGEVRGRGGKGGKREDGDGNWKLEQEPLDSGKARTKS